MILTYSLTRGNISVALLADYEPVFARTVTQIYGFCRYVFCCSDLSPAQIFTYALSRTIFYLKLHRSARYFGPVFFGRGEEYFKYQPPCSCAACILCLF